MSELPPSDTARRACRRALLGATAVLSLVARPAGAQGSGEAWQIIRPKQSTLVFARDDSSLIGEIGREWRTSISIRTLPPYVPQAFIAVEDHRFYQHNGVDVVGIAGALKDALGGHPRGASTITQQLVGNMHPDLVSRADRSIERKLREQNAAREMERHYTKEQILEAYLNQISFGHGWFGIEDAARHYFGKPAAQLTLAEAASLAALPKSPPIWDPIRHPDRNRARRNVVLRLMAEQGYITDDELRSARAEPVVTVPHMGIAAEVPYVIDLVRREARRADVPIDSGGYRIVTTIDAALQRDAVDALDSGIARVERRDGYRHETLAHRAKGSTNVLEGMAVALDPSTGDVLALVGGRDYALSPFDRAVNALRQPGSAFKPFVYAAALADSIPPNAIIPDTALAIQMDRNTIYRPANADGQFLGPLTMREALVRSRNPVAVQLGLRVGIDSIAALAKRLGIDSPIASYPSSAIGSSVVRPLDLVAAYSVFANLGSVVEPRLIRRIDDSTGRAVLTPPEPAPSYAMDPRVAFIVRDMMRDVVERGTATTVRRDVPERIPVAGKTGTTNDNSDVWFIGMTPDVVAGVWLGFDRPSPIVPGAAGGTLAAPIWSDMIGRWYRGRATGAWEPPAGLVAMDLDRDTGLPADSTTALDRRYTEYFLAGTEPGAKFDPWSIFADGPIAF